MTFPHKIGSKYKTFRVTDIVPLKELQCILRLYEEEGSGAKIMHIENDDPENCFCLSLQTLPSSSNGVAHILEHITLCGSKKYPIHDPFFSMNRRSLNTFMNAFTGSDFTCYPAATQVEKDFYNLLAVYLDAVFNPFLSKMSFLQEGHRLEWLDPENPDSPLVFKGVVYNEMKGALSSANSRLSEEISRLIFPNLPYSFNSGGDPKDIPSLTHEELLAFHKRYYHPSRCLFYFYGNLPITNHLDFLYEHTLKDCQKVPPMPQIPLHPRFKKPVKETAFYPIAEGENTNDKTLISFSWLTCSILDQQEALALHILLVMLMDTDASPLKMAFLRSQLCKQAGAVIDLEISEIPISIILKGCNKEASVPLEKLLFTTLKEIASKPLPNDLIEAAIHQMEFQRSEITGDQLPYGLSLFMRAGLLMQQGGPPEEALKIHSLFDRLRERLKTTPNFFNNLIQHYFIDNKHFVALTLVPDPHLAKQEAEEEEARLKKIKENLTPSDRALIKEEAILRQKYQESLEEEDAECLPKVALTDVPKEVRTYALHEEKLPSLNVYHHETFTNEIAYVDISVDLPKLHIDDLFWNRLFVVLHTQLGSGKRNYSENLEAMQAYTGGIQSVLHIFQNATDSSLCQPTFQLSGKALQRNTARLFSLMQDFIKEPRFDDSVRIKEVILKHYTALQGSLSQGALRYASSLCVKGFSTASVLSSAWWGLDYFWKLKELVADLDQKMPLILEKLQHMSSLLMHSSKPELLITCSKEQYQEIKKNSFYGAGDLTITPHSPWNNKIHLSKVPSQGRTISSPVAFISKAIQTVSYSHPDSPGLNLASFIFDNLTLHPKIREQGGAYGGGSSHHSTSGYFSFYSFRDPHVVSTLKAFEEAVEQVLTGDFDESDIEEAKLEMIQGLDSPISPGSRGMVAFGWLKEGKTTSIRQKYRNRLLSCTKNDIQEAVEKHLRTPKECTTIVMGGKTLLESENQILKEEGNPPFNLRSIEEE